MRRRQNEYAGMVRVCTLVEENDMTPQIDEQGACWNIAQDSAEMDWAGFTAWLEVDPRHREAFDAIALLDERIDANRPTLAQLLSDERAADRPRRFYPTALAAVAATGIAAIVLHLPERAAKPAGTIAYAAPVGRSRIVRLIDGSVATLAPGSVLRVAAARDVPMTLEGRAFFDVRHNAKHPITLRAAGYTIRDVGTRFDVSTAAGTLRVAVAEGRVAIGGSGKTTEIGAGSAVLGLPGGRIETIDARSDAIGAWRRGVLDYDNVPLAIVAADIAGYTGQPVAIAPAAGHRRFSGVIAIGDRGAMVSTLVALSGLETRMDGDAVYLDDSARR